VDFADEMNQGIGRLGASKAREKMVMASIGGWNDVVLVFAVRFCRDMPGTRPEVENPIGADLLSI
jgi:hypothetical protein